MRLMALWCVGAASIAASVNFALWLAWGYGDLLACAALNASVGVCCAYMLIRLERDHARTH